MSKTFRQTVCLKEQTDRNFFNYIKRLRKTLMRVFRSLRYKTPQVKYYKFNRSAFSEGRRFRGAKQRKLRFRYEKS